MPLTTARLAAACLLLCCLVSEASTEKAAAQPVDSTLFQGLAYRMIGPFRGGRSTAVAGVSGQPHRYLMGTTGGGVWQTADAGQSWGNVSDGFFGGSIGAVAVAENDPSTIYVGTGSACIRGNTSTGHGAYKSADGGKTWTFIGLEEAGQIGDLQVHPKNADLVYAAALGHPFGKNEERGVYRSKDGGASWEKVLYASDSTGAVDLAMNPHNPRELYAAMWRGERKPWVVRSGSMDGGIYKTTDGGDTWTRLENGLPDSLVGKAAVTVSPANPDRVWAIIEAKEPHGGVYRSDDAGTSWTRVNRDRDLRQRAYYYMHINADPQDPNTVYALNVGLHKSVDGGKTFERVEVPHGDVHDLWIRPDDPQQMVVANDGGAQVSTNGGQTWTTYYNQPTAEMYSVAVDNGFPYRVYGPQQDNSTISVPAWTEGGLAPEQHWKSIGGCETGPVDFDPDDPSVVYAGCYGGTLTRHDEATGATRNVMVYPQLQLGQIPRDLKERFQWVSPLVVSRHDPQTIYHASQHVFRTGDGGHAWTRISPDLSTNNPAHQEAGGAPITNEATGVEVYGTVFALTESPHTAGTLWAGSDDGRMHVTRDDGETWTDITPGDMPAGGTVNTIEVSPHAAGTAYAAVYRYREDDFSPYIFKTTDYGASWQALAGGENGLPEDYPVRVVREDPERPGLLYAGTEFGMFVSLDDGSTWQPFQQNLPTTPVTDLKVHAGDLVVATQGRSFWIMDDLAPLRQMTDAVAGADRHLFEPSVALLVSPSAGWGENWPEGPPGGAVIHYAFAERPDSTVTLEILSEDGTLLRMVTSDSAKTTGPEPNVLADMEPAARERYEAQKAHAAVAEAERFETQQFVREEEGPLPTKAGLNQFVWNLRLPGLDTVEDAVTWGFTGGAKVVPGRYTVRLTAGGQTLTQPLVVEKDPRLEDVTQEDLEEQFALATDLAATLGDVHDAIRRVRRTRSQVLAVATFAEQMSSSMDLVARADSVAGALTAVEQELIQTRAESFQDAINYPPQLDNQLAYLYGFVAGPNGRPTASARTRYTDLKQEWTAVQQRLGEVMQTEVAAFNAAVQELDLPPVPAAAASAGGTVEEAGERR